MLIRIVLVLYLFTIKLATSAPVHETKRSRTEVGNAEAHSDHLKAQSARHEGNVGSPVDMDFIRQARRESKALRRERKRLVMEGRAEPYKSKGRQKMADSTNIHTTASQLNRDLYKNKVARAKEIVDRAGRNLHGEVDQVHVSVADGRGEMTLKQAQEIVANDIAKRKKQVDVMRNRRAKARIDVGPSEPSSSAGGTTYSHQHEQSPSSIAGHTRLGNEFDLNKMPTSPSSPL